MNKNDEMRYRTKTGMEGNEKRAQAESETELHKTTVPTHSIEMDGKGGERSHGLVL